VFWDVPPCSLGKFGDDLEIIDAENARNGEEDSKKEALIYFVAGFLLGFVFQPEDGSSKLL
jgi:hypothetical protein